MFLLFASLSVVLCFTTLYSNQKAESPYMATQIVSKPASEPTPIKRSKKVVCLTVPKTGTYLVEKAIKMITDIQGKKVFDLTTVRGKKDLSVVLREENNLLFIDHLLPDYDFLRDENSDEYIKIIQIRDPRDMVISQVHWMKKTEQWWMPLETIKKANQLSFEEHLSFVIGLPKEHYGAQFFYNQVLEWKKNPSVFICRFEDLVGPQGGGDRKIQEASIAALAKHIEYSLSDEKITYIADHLFGGTRTFRSGLIGQWKTVMNAEQMTLCQRMFGKQLIALGYAENEGEGSFVKSVILQLFSKHSEHIFVQSTASPRFLQIL